jgi:hypothetical protein
MELIPVVQQPQHNSGLRLKTHGDKDWSVTHDQERGVPN